MATSYPPPGQILSVLGIDLTWADDGTLSGTSSIDPALLGLNGALPGVGALVPLVDIMAGTLAGRLFAPDWQTTTDVWIHEIAPLQRGQITATMTVLRQGKRNMVVRSDVFGDGEAAATATIEFTRINRSASPHTLEKGPEVGQPFRIGSGPLLNVPIHEACDFVTVSADVVDLEKTDFVRNSMGTLQGGAATLLAEFTAVSAVSAGGVSARVVDLHYRFLAQTKEGPARATATMLRQTPASSTVSIEIVDRSAEDTIVGWAVASVETEA